MDDYYEEEKKRIGALIISAVCVILIVVGVWTLRFTNSEFRYNFDVTFNCDDTHYSYSSLEDGTDVVKASLPIPSSTALAFRHSDSAATYYYKHSHEEFLAYYVVGGYTVEENAVHTENSVFIVNDANDQSEEDWKYNFIDTALSEQE